MKNYSIKEISKLKNGKYQQFFGKVKLLFYLDQIKFFKKMHTIDCYSTLFFIYLDHTWFPILH